MYKHIVFDFDGTLVDSTGEIMKMYNEVAVKYNFRQVNQEEFNLLSFLPMKERFQALNVPMYRFLLIRKIGKEFKERYRQSLNMISFIDGMKELVELLLSQGYILSVVTSNSADNVAEFLHMNGLKGFHAIRSSNGLFGKHQTLKKYMKEHQLNRSDILYVGDERRDVVACKRCGIDAAAVTWGLDTRDGLLAEKPNYLAERPQDIIEILDQKKDG